MNMKKYITPEITCYEFEPNQIIASSSDTPGSDSVDMGGPADPGVGADSRNNNSNDIWNSGW